MQKTIKVLNITMSLDEEDLGNLLNAIEIFIWETNHDIVWIAEDNAGVFTGSAGIDDQLREAEYNDDAGAERFFLKLKALAEAGVESWAEEAEDYIVDDEGELWTSDGYQVYGEVADEILGNV